MRDESIFTRAVHADEDRSKHHGAVSVPVYNASVFSFTDVESGAEIHNEITPGYYYGRNGNPTTEALEKTVAELEGGEAALAFASGMAAVSAGVLANVRTGDHIIAPESMYSTTTNFLKHLAQNFGIEVTFVAAEYAEEYGLAIQPNTKIFWIETPSNPLVRITDIRRVAAIAQDAGILTIADNTFATPFNQRPIELGVDIVIHSATKYLGGHSDLTAGVLVATLDMAAHIRKIASKLYGGNIAPQVAWLVMRGIKTLALRMEHHNLNASVLANMLSEQPKVRALHYPGLASHQNHDVARKQMINGFGGIIGLDLGTMEAGKSFINNVKLCVRGTSLGGVETIVQHAASMTYASICPEARLKAGISDGLIRLSVGIEHIDDLARDIVSSLK